MATLFLGLGAQKAGTSWLFHQIKRGSGFRQGLGKEYHVLDSLYVPGLDDFTKRFSSQAGELRKSYDLLMERQPDSRGRLRRLMGQRSRPSECHEATQIKQKIARKERLIGMMTREENYFDYIGSRLNTPETFTLDFTPSYSALTAEHLRRVRQEFARRNVQVRLIFIMRDPVCRLESSVRMDMRDKGVLNADNREAAVQRMLTYGGSEHERSRSNYPAVVQALDAVFPSEDAFIGFYEELFTPSTMADLARFCGIEPDVFDTTRYYNHSASCFTYPRNMICELQERYRDIYDFVGQRFTFDLSLWETSRGRLIED